MNLCKQGNDEGNWDLCTATDAYEESWKLRSRRGDGKTRVTQLDDAGLLTDRRDRLLTIGLRYINFNIISTLPATNLNELNN